MLGKGNALINRISWRVKGCAGLFASGAGGWQLVGWDLRGVEELDVCGIILSPLLADTRYPEVRVSSSSLPFSVPVKT